MARDIFKSFYDSAAWKKQRIYILKRDKFTCTEKGCHRLATEVHHIIELNEKNINDVNITLNEKNLRSLCHDCHTRITKEIKGGYENILPKISFNSDGYIVVENLDEAGV